jgi:hypothetical protein
MNIGDKIRYGHATGEITSLVNGDTAMVKLEDGKEYAVPIDSLEEILDSGYKIADMKNLGTLQEIARALSDAGVKELVIRNGEVTDFRVDKSIDEVVREAQAEEVARHAQRMKQIEEEIRREKEAKAS